jgi:type I restriction enzyme S subunit
MGLERSCERLGDLMDKGVADLQTGPFGTSLHAASYRATGTPVVAVQHIGQGRLLEAEMPHIGEEDTDRLARYKLKQGDILFGRKGAVDRRAIILKSQEGWLQGSDCIRLRLDPLEVDARFVCHYLGSETIRDWLLRHATGATMPSLNQSVLRLLPLILPSLSDQRTIAHILGTLDDMIELNRRMSATLEEMARALFKSWFVDFDPVRAKPEGRPTGLPAEIDALFPDSFQVSVLGEIPAGWEVGKIRDNCDQICNGGTPRRDNPRYWDGGTIPWLGSGEVRQPVITMTENYITQAGMDESSAKWVPSYTTAVALGGATAGQVSIVSLPVTTNQAVCALIPAKNYATYNYLTMRMATSRMENLAVGSAQQNISKGIVEEIRIVVPPAPLIRQFAGMADSLLDKWIANLQQSRTLAALRDTLLPKLISGEIRVGGVDRFL